MIAYSIDGTGKTEILAKGDPFCAGKLKPEAIKEHL